MYSIKVEKEVNIKHKCNYDYPSKENELHTHLWHFIITCKCEELNKNKLIVDKDTISAVLEDVAELDIIKYTPERFMMELWGIIPSCEEIVLIEDNKTTYSLKK